MSSPASSPAAESRVLVAAGTTPRAALEAAGIDINGPSGVVVVRDSAGVLRDLDVPFDAADEVEPVAIDSADGARWPRTT